MSELHLIADDPTPTTGGPVDYEFAEGCRCYIREDVEYGDVLTRPPGGCPVHSCTCFALDGHHRDCCLIMTIPGGKELAARAADRIQDWWQRHG